MPEGVAVLKTFSLTPGATGGKLKKGIYTVWCPMEGHAQDGESVALTVVDD